MSDFRDFPGTIGNYISVTPPAEVAVGGPWTFGAWVRPDVNTGVRVILRVGTADNAPTRGFMLTLNGLTPRVRAVSNNFNATNPLVEDAWNRVGLTKVNSGIANINHSLDGVANGGENALEFVAIDGTDPFQIGGTAVGGLGYTYFDGGVAWAFWLNGVTLSAAAIDAYLNDPQSLIDDYGPAGAVTPDALKIFWPMQCDTATEEDKSGVGNDGTRTGTVALETTSGPTPTTDWDPCAPIGPTITDQPDNATVLLSEGSSASFTVEFTGTDLQGVTWNVDDSPVADGGIYDIVTVIDPGGASGTSTLTVTPVATTGSPFDVDADVEDVNGTTPSATATLTVLVGDVLSAASGTTDSSGEAVTQYTTDASAAAGTVSRVQAVSGGVTKTLAMRPGG